MESAPAFPVVTGQVAKTGRGADAGGPFTVPENYPSVSANGVASFNSPVRYAPD
jgi:hypothetical protein